MEKTTRKLDGLLAHQVFRKMTHTNQYFDANSHHHPSQKCATRSFEILNEEHLEDEKLHFLLKIMVIRNVNLPELSKILIKKLEVNTKLNRFPRSL
jgi:hypothetical protein